MNIKIPKFMSIPLGVIIFCLLLYLSVITFMKYGFKMRDYSNRFKKCEPNLCISDLEQIFDINIPNTMYNIRCAISPPVERSIFVILRFDAEPNSFEQFKHSFRKKELLMKAYNASSDDRSSFGWWRPPEWFTDPIKQGEIGEYREAIGKINFYISKQPEKFTYYITGDYIKPR